MAGLGEALRFALEHSDVNREMVEGLPDESVDLLFTWSTRMSIGRWLREARRRYVEKRLAWKSVEKQVEKTYEGCYWRSI